MVRAESLRPIKRSLKMRYLDHAATAFPREAGLDSAMASGLKTGNPGRGGHGPAILASQMLHDARVAVSGLFGLKRSERCVFHSGATAGLNDLVQHFARAHKGGTVLSTDLEHNAVARPLHEMQRCGLIRWKALPASGGRFPEALEKELRVGPVAAVFVNHISNVSGERQLLPDISTLCGQHGVALVVDAAQSAGCESLDIQGLTALVASAHKGLRGPMGVGFSLVPQLKNMEPSRFGGTGGSADGLDMPAEWPNRLEVGTPNLPGIIGLGYVCGNLVEKDLEQRRREIQRRREWLYDALAQMGSGVHVIGPREGGQTLSIVLEGVDQGEWVHRMWVEHEFCLRAGLHCAPLAHRSLGTWPGGTVRLSPSHDTPLDDLELLVEEIHGLGKKA